MPITEVRKKTQGMMAIGISNRRGQFVLFIVLRWSKDRDTHAFQSTILAVALFIISIFRKLYAMDKKLLP